MGIASVAKQYIADLFRDNAFHSGKYFSKNGHSENASRNSRQVSTLTTVGLGLLTTLSALVTMAGCSSSGSEYTNSGSVNSGANVTRRISPETWVKAYGDMGGLEVKDAIEGNFKHTGAFKKLAILNGGQKDVLVAVDGKGKLQEIYRGRDLQFAEFMQGEDPRIAVLRDSDFRYVDFGGNSTLRSKTVEKLPRNRELATMETYRGQPQLSGKEIGSNILVGDIDNNGFSDIVVASYRYGYNMPPDGWVRSERNTVTLKIERQEWDWRTDGFVSRDVPYNIKLAETVKFLENNPNLREAGILISPGGSNETRRLGMESSARYLQMARRSLVASVGDNVVRDAEAVVDKIESKKPELLLGSVKDIIAGEDPSERIASALNVDAYLGREVFDGVLKPYFFRINPETGALESVGIPLYSKDGRFLGFPYKDDITLLVGLNPRSAGDIALRYTSATGRDGSISLKAEVRTSLSDISARKVPNSNFTLSGYSDVVEKSVDFLQALGRGDTFNAGRLAVEIKEDLDFRFDPETESTIQDFKNMAALAEGLFNFSRSISDSNANQSEQLGQMEKLFDSLGRLSEGTK